MITITIDTENSAFDAQKGFEVARILRDLADRIQFDGNFTPEVYTHSLRDSNGNTVGGVKIS